MEILPADTSLICADSPEQPSVQNSLPLPGAELVMAFRLRRVLELMITLLWANIGQRGAKTWAGKIKGTLRRVRAIERQNMAEYIKNVLRRCPEWRARVFEELGGEKALRRWEARLRRAWTPAPKETPGDVKFL